MEGALDALAVGAAVGARLTVGEPLTEGLEEGARGTVG